MNDIFFGKLQKISKGIIHLNTSVVSQIFWQIARSYFSDHSKMLFPVENNFPKERWEKLDFITFKE